MNEIWKSIKGFEGLYEVSNLGNVKSQTKVLKPQKETHGYSSVSLSKNGVRKSYKIHRLVAEAFLVNPYNKKCVNHIDGNKKNNSVDNLEWVTQQENNQHAWDNNLNRNTEKQREAARKFCLENRHIMRKALKERRLAV